MKTPDKNPENIPPDGVPFASVLEDINEAIHIVDLAEIKSLNVRLQQMNEALIVSGVELHEMKESTERLNARLRRAMQESHHRIKNNLQIISALVEIQMGDVGVSTSDDHLKRINQHIRALASLHDLLTHQAKADAPVDYLSTQALLGRLIPMLQETSGGRSIKAEVADVLLSTDKSVSLSLLVSECISNAIKHTQGDVEVTLRREGDRVRLDVCDHGGGFAADFDWKTAGHTGLDLIDSTVRHDLRGEVRYENRAEGGGRVAITFPFITPVIE
jgi:two-component sensor histidine kinase